jgi:predicted HTH domain antitoxin
MTVKALEINLPSDLFIALNKSEEELKKEMRVFTAMKFYETGKLTLGKAAQFAGIPRWEFENVLAVNNIPVSNLQYEEVTEDLNRMSLA